MAEIDLTEIPAASIAIPAPGVLSIFAEAATGILSTKDSNGVVRTTGAQSVVAGTLIAAPPTVSGTAITMLGLANLSVNNIITPGSTGRIWITINGVVAQSTTADGAVWHIRTGTGVAPIHGAAVTGVQQGGQQAMKFLTGVLSVPFSISDIVIGAAVGVPLWIDLGVATVTGGVATFTQVNVSAFEV